MLTNIPHIKQQYDWDCGLACVRMVLKRALPMTADRNFEDLCKQLGFGTNVWTIDLANILTYLKVNYAFYTETLGVDMSYRSSSFYEESFEVDELRVKQLFSCAEELDIKVKKR